MTRKETAGPCVAAVRRELAPLPKSLQEGAIAANALLLASLLDRGICFADEDGEHSIQAVGPREIPAFTREIRQSITTLLEMAPGEVKGDKTDEVRVRREQRQSAGA
jgi:hypothetical protein